MGDASMDNALKQRFEADAAEQNPKVVLLPTAPLSGWRKYVNSVIAAEISAFSRYFSQLIQWRPRTGDNGLLLQKSQCAQKKTVREISQLQLAIEQQQRNNPIDAIHSNTSHSLILLNGNINHQFDIQAELLELKQTLTRFDRVALVAYNPYLKWLYTLANTLGLRQGEQPTTFVTRTTLNSLAKIAGYEVVKLKPVVYSPFKCFGLGDLINKLLPAIPGVKWLSLANVVMLRPIIADKKPRSVTIVIPARNEKGNIENALQRIPDLGAPIEVIFIEGHSKDGTWEEIQRVLPLYQDKFKLQAYQQTGKGKSDAVRLGFAKASNEILLILDADLTMPPELIPRFTDAFTSGLGDFINGNRLVYPMQGEAMKFLNKLGNVFFAKSLATVLELNIGDSLCGTKVVTRHDYERMIAWRGDFGDFDPFGDFELLFPSSVLGLGVVDVPIRYLDRTYGSTNIRRFYHGAMLLRMTLIGLLRLKTGQIK